MWSKPREKSSLFLLINLFDGMGIDRRSDDGFDFDGRMVSGDESEGVFGGDFHGMRKTNHS